ncbi:hypothetical protein Godav_024527, partial [Gossypium davidsonii]|nr:hypothetical protein [Gossypium davidsonii]
PKNLVVLKLIRGDIEYLWNDDDHQGLVNLKEINVADCKNLRKIPSLLGAINLEILECSGCESLVELPWLNHLTSLNKLGLTGCCNLKTFPVVPKHFPILELSDSKIEEVPDSIEHLVRLIKLCLKNSKVNTVSSNISKLESLHDLNLSHCPMTEFPEIPRSLRTLNLSGTQIKEVTLSLDSLNNLQMLKMSCSSIQKLQCSIILFGLREIPTVDVSSPILMSKSIYRLQMDHCESLTLLSELPPYIPYLDAHGCTSLEKVSFTNLDPLDDDVVDWFYMLFCNCFSLNQDSIDNIEANAMLKIGYLAEKQRLTWDTSSSLVLKIAPNGSSGSRFLVFSICLVADLTRCHHHEYLKFICEYQLTTASGGDYEKFTSQWSSCTDLETERKYMGDHVLILFSEDMVKKDEDYQGASFEFYIENPNYNVEGEEIEDEYIKVEKCGVHVSYMDEEPSTTPTT